jgi:hypothetical protein
MTSTSAVAGADTSRDFDRHLEEAFADGRSEMPSAAADVPDVPRFSGSTLDLAALQDHWKDFTEVVRGSKAMLAHCLSEGRPQTLQDGILGIGFSEEHAFHLNLMRENRTQRELEKQIERFFGKRLKVSLVDTLSSGSPSSGGPSSGRPTADSGSARLTPEDVAESRREAAQDALQRTPRMQEILDAFDGEILEDNQTGPGGA